MTPKADSVAVLRDLRRYCDHFRMEAYLPALEAAIAALEAQGEAAAWRAVPVNGGRSPQTTWIAMPVSQWALADVKAGVCTIEYAYLRPAPPGAGDADVRALVDWIFSRFGAPFGDVVLPDHIVAAVRRLEAALAARTEGASHVE